METIKVWERLLICGRDTRKKIKLPIIFHRILLSGIYGKIFEDLVARKESRKPRYNAWGNPVVQQSISKAISEMRRLQKTVALAKSEIRTMREEGRLNPDLH